VLIIEHLWLISTPQSVTKAPCKCRYCIRRFGSQLAALQWSCAYVFIQAERSSGMGEGALGSAMQGLWENYELSSYVMHTHTLRECVIENQKHWGVWWEDSVIISVQKKAMHNQPSWNTSFAFFVVIVLLLPLLVHCILLLCLSTGTCLK